MSSDHALLAAGLTAPSSRTAAALTGWICRHYLATVALPLTVHHVDPIRPMSTDTLGVAYCGSALERDAAWWLVPTDLIAASLAGDETVWRICRHCAAIAALTA